MGEGTVPVERQTNQDERPSSGTASSTRDGTESGNGAGWMVGRTNAADNGRAEGKTFANGIREPQREKYNDRRKKRRSALPRSKTSINRRIANFSILCFHVSCPPARPLKSHFARSSMIQGDGKKEYARTTFAVLRSLATVLRP